MSRCTRIILQYSGTYFFISAINSAATCGPYNLGKVREHSVNKKGLRTSWSPDFKFKIPKQVRSLNISERAEGLNRIDALFINHLIVLLLTSILFCSKAGLNYVSCSPYRVPVARLAAAQAELKNK